MPQEDRATAIDNMHNNWVKMACGPGNILADTHTHTCSSQYFATAPAVEVKHYNEQDNEVAIETSLSCRRRTARRSA